jgi:hypothetical protein
MYMDRMICLRTILAKVILGEPGCILQYNACDEVIANILDFILEEICNFGITGYAYICVILYNLFKQNEAWIIDIGR